MWQFCCLQHTIIRANTFHVATIFGCCATAVRLSPPWSPENRKEIVGSKRRPSGAASFRKAASAKSAMVPHCETWIVSQHPLGKETSSFMELSATCSLTALLSMAPRQDIVWKDFPLLVHCCFVSLHFPDFPSDPTFLSEKDPKIHPHLKLISPPGVTSFISRIPVLEQCPIFLGVSLEDMKVWRYEDEYPYTLSLSICHYILY
jgi:hypothetical protein